jgi:NAD+ diphosphatase
VAVTREGENGRRELLLARGPRHRPGFYSILAGFVEPGETLEACVAREVKEEVGIDIQNIRYFGSQPWPFPHSLMIGFTAEYAGGDFVLQEDEIEEAGWYTADNLPNIPPPLSVSRQLIDDFVVRQQQSQT